MMTFSRSTRSVLLALLLALAPPAAAVIGGLVPVAAEARPGMGTSMGSRGSRSYSAPAPTRTDPGGAAPFERSIAPRATPYGNGYGGGYANRYGGGLRAHPFATGLLGGLVGAGIGGMLLGHGFFGGGYGGGFGGGGSLLGLLIQLAILFFVARWLFRRFARRGRIASPGFAPNTGGIAAPGAPGATVAITPADYNQFERALLDIQQAWSMGDMRSLARFATPEMASYFNEQLGDLASRNLRNAVSAVRMEQGDLSEAWSENGRDFASVAMRYSMIDVTTDLTGRVVDGSPTERQVVVEIWTFVRARGGSWLLSAIQQAR